MKNFAAIIAASALFASAKPTEKFQYRASSKTPAVSVKGNG